MQILWLRALVVVACGLCWIGISAAPALANTYTVINTNDSGPGSLRYAMTSANANESGPNTIDFAIPDTGVQTNTGVQTISPISALPTITNPVVIDATSQCLTCTGPSIQLDGGAIAGAGVSGLLITAGQSTVRGLEITGWGNRGIELQGSSNLIAGNYLGTDGSRALGNVAAGVIIDGGATHNTIGGTVASDRNLVSGNDKGVVIAGSSTSSNLVEGNYIGTDTHGSSAIGNAKDGVLVVNGAYNNTVGGTLAGAGNLTSGNGAAGVDVTASGSNTVLGNYIGTDATGTAPLGNQKGVGIGGGSPNNLLGGTTTGARNLISGNLNRGVVIGASGSSGNLVEGNYIGTNATGAAQLANGLDGILVFNSATSNTIGGTATGAGNVISGNRYDGVFIINPGTSRNLVQGNYIGTDANGSSAIGNAGGVLVAGSATNNTIGGTVAGAGNTIGFNAGTGGGINDFNVAFKRGVGVQVDAGSTTGDAILSNSIFANSSTVGIALTNGGNANEPVPTVSSVTTSSTSTTISGTVTAGNIRVEVFVNPNPSCGDPEGKKFLGSAKVSRNPRNRYSWSLTVAKLASDQGVTATATRTSTSNTSQFSSCKSS
jgi:trimeric autotransporter adhesin